MQIRLATLAGVLFALAACGGDGGGGGGGGGSGGGPGSGSGECGIRGLTDVMPEQAFPSPIIRMELDGDAIFFNVFDAIHSVPRAGGTPTKVYPPPGETAFSYPPFWIFGGDLVVGRGDELQVLPKTGADAVAETRSLPFPYKVWLDGSVDILLADDGHTFFAKNDPVNILGDDPPAIDYWSYDFETDTSVTIAEDSTIGHLKRIVLAGTDLYTASRIGDATDPDDDTADRLYRIPGGGGAPELVPMEGDYRFDLLGGDDTHLIFLGRPWPQSSDLGGIYRIAHTGGAPEKVANVFYLSSRLAVRFVNRPERMLLWILGDLWSIPHGSGQATRLASTRCNIFAIAMEGDDVYLAIQDDSGERSRIARFTID